MFWHYLEYIKHIKEFVKSQTKLVVSFAHIPYCDIYVGHIGLFAKLKCVDDPMIKPF